VQCSAVPFSAVQCSAVPCSAVDCANWSHWCYNVHIFENMTVHGPGQCTALHCTAHCTALHTLLCISLLHSPASPPLDEIQIRNGASMSHTPSQTAVQCRAVQCSAVQCSAVHTILGLPQTRYSKYFYQPHRKGKGLVYTSLEGPFGVYMNF
jgi:hypothetical protein